MKLKNIIGSLKKINIKIKNSYEKWKADAPLREQRREVRRLRRLESAKRELEFLKIKAEREELLARTESARAKKLNAINKAPRQNFGFGGELDLGIGLPKPSKTKDDNLFGGL